VNYKIVKIDEQYSILETATGHYVYSHPSKNEAKKMLKHFNLGGGFDSWTPAFILKGKK